MEGLVIKKIADSFNVKTKEGVFTCISRKNLKSDGVFVGDSVVIDCIDGQYTIEKVNERKNIFIRPPLANLDKLIIVIAELPKPDFNIVDKLILFALSYGVKPIIVVNKIDLDKGLCNYVKNTYTNVVEKVLFTNTITGQGVDELKQFIKNSLCSFAGQSAVGKSALVNAIMKEHLSTVGEISIKNQKGKNTTRHCEIFFEDDVYITDTAGFTSLDEKLLPISYFELPYYYPDYVSLMEGCRFKSCSHVNEKKEDCVIKQAVLNGLLDKDRYLRYKEIYNTLYKKWVKTHG